MSLRDVSWRPYYPGNADHVDEIFIPALEQSKTYDRITGDFSASVLSVLSPGLKDFIRRGGKIRLMAGLRLFKEDLEAIQRGEFAEIVTKQINWDAVETGQPKEVREALAWLVANDVMDIKLGAVMDDRGNIRSSDYGQWHQKIAIFTDETGDSVGMAGSPNASFKALQRNRESLTPHSNWEKGPGSQKTMAGIIQEFDSLWRDDAEGAAVMPVPEAVKKRIIEPAPDEEPDWDSVTSAGHDYGAEDEKIEPRLYQNRALERLAANDNRLLVKHATGTGKTWTALFAIEQIAEPGDVVVLLAPTKDLVKQWASEDNLRQFFPDATIVTCSSDFDWKRKLYNRLHVALSEPLFVVSTMHPVTMRTVFDMVEDATTPGQRLIIADEVHNVGASTTGAVLEEFEADKARIGLSATPFRGDSGDELIERYFGSEIDEVTLEEAINKYETLSSYKYHIHSVVLSDNERQEYIERSKEISHLYHKYRKSEDEPVLTVADRHLDLQTEVFARADILKECAAKTEKTRELFESIGSKTLVFCNKKNHAQEVRRVLDSDSQRKVQTFLGEDSGEERDALLEYFEDGFVDTLVSIDCLTEGIDVPACDSAVLIANSSSTRESVQRRGRVLRKDNEGHAEIHDFLTLPVEENEISSADLVPAEVQLIEKELDRVDAMNEAAKNQASNNVNIINLRQSVRQQQTHDSD